LAGVELRLNLPEFELLDVDGDGRTDFIILRSSGSEIFVSLRFVLYTLGLLSATLSGLLLV